MPVGYVGEALGIAKCYIRSSFRLSVFELTLQRALALEEGSLKAGLQRGASSEAARIACRLVPL